jgi:hypothetical protein
MGCSAVWFPGTPHIAAGFLLDSVVDPEEGGYTLSCISLRITRRRIPQVCTLHTHSCENLRPNPYELLCIVTI